VNFNRVVIAGRLTADVELRYTAGGTAVTNITLAINRRRKDQQGEWIDEATFVEVTLWGRTAEVAGEYTKKGDPLHVEGRLEQDRWEDKDSGQKRSKLKVVGESIQLVGTRSEEGPERRKQTTPPDREEYFPADDAPF